MATNDAPAKGAAQQAKNEAPKVVTDASPATGHVIKGSAIGVAEQAPSDGVVLEGLGNLNDPIAPMAHEDTSSGDGEYVVVLHELVSGVRHNYSKGDVRRVSNFIPGYGDKKRTEEARANAKRLFDGKAIRLATSSEQGMGHIEIGEESDALTKERNRVMDLERQVEELKKAQSLDKTVTEPQGPPAGADWS